MLIAALGQYFFGITIFITSMFLIMLVLVQRGRGGGLAGALGGPGGQSAFGTKAGDLFTRITIGVAAVWIFLCAAAVVSLKAKKFTTNVTKPDATTSGSMSAAGDSATDTTSTETNGSGSGLPNAATRGLEMTTPSDSAAVPAANTPAANTPAATTETGTAEVSELPAETPATATDAPATDAPATDAPGTEAPVTEESDELTLDDPADTTPAEQP